MRENNYRIKYREGNFEVEVQGDKDWVEKKFKELMEGKPIIFRKTTQEETETLPTSLVEFVRAKGNPKGHPDIAIIFSYWLHKRKKNEIVQ